MMSVRVVMDVVKLSGEILHRFYIFNTSGVLLQTATDSFALHFSFQSWKNL